MPSDPIPMPSAEQSNAAPAPYPNNGAGALIALLRSGVCPDCGLARWREKPKQALTLECECGSCWSVEIAGLAWE